MKLIILVLILLLSNIDIFCDEVNQIRKIIAPVRNADTRFGGGESIISGDRLLIGAYADDYDENDLNYKANGGSVYYYERVNSEWVFRQKIVSPSISENSYFGDGIALQDDVLVVNSVQDDKDENNQNILFRSGSVFIYNLVNGVWVFQKKITSPDRIASETFGGRAAFHGDFLFVTTNKEGEDENELNTLSNAGAVYVYKRNQGGVNNWGFYKKIVAFDRQANQSFGFSVSADNDNLFIGDNQGSGNLYIFNKNQGGTDNWGFIKKITPPDGNAGDQFSFTQKVYGDLIAVSSRFHDYDGSSLNFLSNSGAVYLYQKDEGGTDNWGLLKKIVAPVRGSLDEFGRGIYLYDDKLIASSIKEDHDENNLNPISDAGAVYLFEKDEGGTDNWSFAKKFVANDRATSDEFENNIHLNNREIIIGSQLSDLDGNGLNFLNQTGAAYYFKIQNTPTIENFVISQNISLNATFNVEVQDNGDETTVFLEYGTQSGTYTEKTSNQVLAGDGITHTLEFELENLSKDIRYYVRINSTNSIGHTTSSELSFIARVYTDDLDGDGIIDSLENSAPNSGDGNFDGIQDLQQANVASFESIAGSYITIELSSCADLLFVSNNARTSNGEFEFPFRVVSFSAPCSEANVKIYYHNVSDLSLFTYRKEIFGERWINYEESEFSVETINGEQVAIVTFSLTDGGVGDSDGEINGMIVDPGGPAIPITANIPIWDWWWVLVLVPVMVYGYKRFR